MQVVTEHNRTYMTWILEIALYQKRHILVRSTNQIDSSLPVLMKVGALKIGAM